MALRAEERRDKLRKAAGRSKYPLSRRYLNGETRLDELQSSIRQSITYGREPGELKHLSSRRNRKKQVLSLERNIDFQSSGERNGRSLNRNACIPGLRTATSEMKASGTDWEIRPERVRAPYTKAEVSGRDPKYHETRGTLWEVGGTTPQG